MDATISTIVLTGTVLLAIGIAAPISGMAIAGVVFLSVSMMLIRFTKQA